MVAMRDRVHSNGIRLRNINAHLDSRGNVNITILLYYQFS